MSNARRNMRNNKTTSLRDYKAGKNRQAYIDGNAARELAPARKTRTYEDERNRQKRRNEKIERENRLSKIAICVITSAAVAVLVIGFQYLSDLNSMKRKQVELSTLQDELVEKTKANDEYEDQINESVNYDELYNTAVNDLGMSNPAKAQIITYDAGVSEYVKQYGDIPEAK